MSYFCMRAPLQTAMGGTDAGGAGSGVPAGAAPPAHPASCTIGHPWGGSPHARTPPPEGQTPPRKDVLLPKRSHEAPTANPIAPAPIALGGATASLPAVPRRARVGWVPPRTDEARAPGAASGPGCSRSGERPAPNRRARRGARVPLRDGSRSREPCPAWTTTAVGAWDPGDRRPWELEPFPAQNSPRREPAPPQPARGWPRVSGLVRRDNRRR